MKTTRVTREPNGTTIVWEEEVKDMLKTGIDTLQQARMLNASIEKERPYYFGKKRLPKNWQLDLHDFIVDRGMVVR